MKRIVKPMKGRRWSLEAKQLVNEKGAPHYTPMCHENDHTQEITFHGSDGLYHLGFLRVMRDIISGEPATYLFIHQESDTMKPFRRRKWAYDYIDGLVSGIPEKPEAIQ